MQWTDIFSEVSGRKVGNCGTKTLPADQITWQGLFRGHAVCVVSSVRLVLGRLAHFNVNFAARIGAHGWTLPGGHYIDLAVQSHPELSDEDLLAIGELAMTMDTRPVRVRRRSECLAEGTKLRTLVR